MDDQAPAPDLLVIFYNKFIDEYRICTYDKLEQDFRYMRANFGDLMDESTGDDWVDYQLLHTFQPTHWTNAPLPPYEEYD